MNKKKQIIKDPKQAKDRKHLLIAIILTELGLVIRTLLIILAISIYIVGMALDAIIDGFSDMCGYYNESYHKQDTYTEENQDTLTWGEFDESTYSEQCTLIKDYIITEHQTDNQNDLSRDEIEIIKIQKNNDATIPFAPTNNKYNIIVKVKEEYIWITLYTDDIIEEAPVDLEHLQKAHIIQ